jgi:hypothetical protein
MISANLMKTIKVFYTFLVDTNRTTTIRIFYVIILKSEERKREGAAEVRGGVWWRSL